MLVCVCVREIAILLCVYVCVLPRIFIRHRANEIHGTSIRFMAPTSTILSDTSIDCFAQENALYVDTRAYKPMCMRITGVWQNKA